MLKSLIASLLGLVESSGAARRLGATVAAVLVPIINQHLSVPLDSNSVGLIMGSLMTYVVQSSVKAMVTAPAKVATADQAVAVLKSVAPNTSPEAVAPVQP